MGTAYSDVFDSFMSRIKDWRLDALYASSVIDFEVYLTAFLKSAIEQFDNCSQSLSRDDTTRTFDETLTEKNVIMLAKFMVEAWLEKEVQDVRQMNLSITDKDFKHFSEAQNLKEKNNRWSEVRERNSQDYVDYGYKNLNLSNWLSGDFYPLG